jgi:hypothetical protein
MSAFLVTVHAPGREPLTYREVAADSIGLVMDAQDRFGPCRVFVTLA